MPHALNPLSEKLVIIQTGRLMEKVVEKNRRSLVFSNLMLLDLCRKNNIHYFNSLKKGPFLSFAGCDGRYSIRLMEKDLLELCWICWMLFHEIDGKNRGSGATP